MPIRAGGRTLEIPRDAPAGATTQLTVEGLRDALVRLTRAEPADARAVTLALEAADALSADRFDRLLCLDVVQGIVRYPHQIETVLRVLKRFRGRVLLADEVGLGKTIEAALVLKEYLLRGQVNRALVLCPPALVAQWRAELAEKFAIAARTSLDGSLREAPGAFFEAPGVVVFSMALARSERYRMLMKEQRFDLVIVDEAHHLKNRGTRAWDVVNTLRSRFLLMLSATPVETNLTELYNLVTLLRPGTLGTEVEFRRRYQDPRDPLMPRSPERLRELLAEVMIRNTRAQSGIDLPPRTARTIVIDQSLAERELYADLVRLARGAGGRERLLSRLLLEQAGSSARAVARTAEGAVAPTERMAASLRAITSRARSVEGSAKAERLIDLLPGGKTLVFTRFLGTHEALAEELRRRRIGFASFTGAMSAAQRAVAVEELRGPVDVMLCSEVGGEGQNLQFCHRLINYDLPWNPMLLEQRIGRIHRIGQAEPVEIVNLCSAGTAEQHMLEILDRRINLFELVVGELDMLLGDLEDEREFGDRIFDIYATSETSRDVEAQFEELASLMTRARERLQRTKAADDAIFGNDLGA